MEAKPLVVCTNTRTVTRLKASLDDDDDPSDSLKRHVGFLYNNMFCFLSHCLIVSLLTRGLKYRRKHNNPQIAFSKATIPSKVSLSLSLSMSFLYSVSLVLVQCMQFLYSYWKHINTHPPSSYIFFLTLDLQNNVSYVSLH